MRSLIPKYLSVAQASQTKFICGVANSQSLRQNVHDPEGDAMEYSRRRTEVCSNPKLQLTSFVAFIRRLKN